MPDESIVDVTAGEPLGATESAYHSAISDDRFDRWVAGLEARHLAALTFPELSRALRALSSTYVERRSRIGRGGALTGAGKRAAFALYYGPLHYLLVRLIVQGLPDAARTRSTIVDLGCGTGAAGAGWASACTQSPRVVGIDRHPWVLGEAARTYAAFGLRADVRQGDVGTVALPPQSSLVAAFTVNELQDAPRDALLSRLIARARGGDQVLVVEPMSRRVVPWWSRWTEAFAREGGRADEWRFRPALPSIVSKLDRATGLRHTELTGRSLWLSSAPRESAEKFAD
jgi:hypothetical protein